MIAYFERSKPYTNFDIGSIVCELVIPDRFYNRILPAYRKPFIKSLFNFSSIQRGSVFYDGGIMYRYEVNYEEELFASKENSDNDNINFMIFSRVDGDGKGKPSIFN